jgi:hypothetical protein
MAGVGFSDGDKGDITISSSGTVLTIDNDAVTYAKLQNVSATNRLLGRSSAGAGDVEELDAATARTVLSVQPTASPTFTGNARVNSSDSATSLLVNGATKGVRFATSSTATAIEGVDSTGTGSYQPLIINGSTVTIQSNGGTSAITVSTSQTATFTGQILADDLTTSNSVVYGFDGDTNTGVGRGGADILTFVTNGTERVRVDASGNVGIGTTSAAGRLHAYNGADATTAVLIGEVSGAFSNAADMSLRRGGTELGRVSADYFDGMNFLVTSGSGNAAVQRMRINTGGELMIGTTTDNGAYLLQVNSQIYATNATIATSDARFKTNVEALTDATSVIESLRPVAFDFIPQEDRNFATERQVGLIAQEAQAALAGTDYADSVVAQCGDHLGLAYEKLVPVLIKALQESNARIAALEERING